MLKRRRLDPEAGPELWVLSPQQDNLVANADRALVEVVDVDPEHRLPLALVVL